MYVNFDMFVLQLTCFKGIELKWIKHKSAKSDVS